MGVPRFFRWVAERWPCVYQTMKSDSAPPTDNLYLNLNSVLQDAALQSGGHGDIDAILEHVEQSIEKLVNVIKPQAILFLAIDGVVPKAKMMRHRSTKFRIAENMKLASAAAARRGEVLKTVDLNALTAGTEFMMELMQRLKSFARSKISQDPSWSPRVILSGSDVPGEADHKILDYLRNLKHSGEWRPNQRHAFYGLDAATLISALVIHEPHCYLFKERSSKSKGSKGPAARVMLENNLQEEFHMCSVGLLRDYLEMELESQLPRSFHLDLERVVDDFVLFCVIAGNDFLPGLECFDGVDALMENLMESYRILLPVLGGYITQMGRVNGERLQKVLDHCCRAEEANVQLQLKAIHEGASPGKQSGKDFLFLSNRAARDILNETDSPEKAIQAWKDRHYRAKFQIAPHEKQTVVTQYFEGLNWAMRCFYRGLPSWTWYYPHHYAPMISDMKDMDPAKVLFRMGNPPSMLFHLMSVLPCASHKLAPQILQPLISNPKSPLASYYPNDCRVDMEGKRMDWEAVVLLPFLDDRRLEHILSRVPQSRLSRNEIEQTKTGHSLIFTSNKGLIRVALAVHGTGGDTTPQRKQAESSDLCSLSSLRAFRSELVSGTSTGIYAPAGYWTLHSHKVPVWHPYDCCSAGCTSYPSEKRSLQLTVPPAASLSCPELLIGRVVFVDWPSLHRARVIRIEDRRCITSMKTDFSTEPSMPTQICQEQHVSKQNLTSEQWTTKVDGITQRLREKKGIEVGLVDVLVTVKKISGALRQGLDILVERYGPEEIYPLPAVLLENVYPNHPVEAADEQKLSLCAHDRLVYVGEDYPGTVATVLENDDSPRDGSQPTTTGGIPAPLLLGWRDGTGGVDPCLGPDESVLASLQVYSPTAMSSLRASQKLLRSCVENYYPSGAVATRLGVTPQGLSRITGSLWVNTGNERQEIGLAVKLGSKNMCVVGYVRPSSNGTGWEYTESLIRILEDYRNAFYWVFEAVDATPEGGEISLKNVFPHRSDADLNELVMRTKAWLSQLPLAGRPLVTAEACVGSIVAIQQVQMSLSLSSSCSKPLLTRLPRTQLIPPADRSSIRSKEVGGEMCIGDYVVYVGSSLISFGSPGVVIGILLDQAEILFSSRVMHAVSILGDSTKQCSCLVNTLDLINISRLTGEDRPLLEIHQNKSHYHHQRVKSGTMGRSQSHHRHQMSQSSVRRRGRVSWNERASRVPPEALSHLGPPLHDPNCTIRPVMALPAYGSGVYIPGMTPMPSGPLSERDLDEMSGLGVQGDGSSHPIPFINYSLAPRY